MERAHSVKMKPMWLPSVLLCAVSADSPEGTNTKSTASSGILPHRRGVHPDKYSFYDESCGVFTCLKHPDVQIPLESVNDDYCDCWRNIFYSIISAIVFANYQPFILNGN